MLGGSEVIGVLGRRSLIQGLAQQGPDHLVAEIMTREFLRLHPDDDLDKAMELLRQSDGLPILIFDEAERLVGFINNDNLMEYIMVQGARDRSRSEAAETA